MPVRRVYFYLSITIILVAAGLSGGLYLTANNGKIGSDDQGIVIMGKGSRPDTTASTPPIGGPFTLINHDGKPTSSTDFQGRHMLIFFGYTYCPDVCPQTLSSISEALNTLGDDLEKVQPLFISVDPVRDNPEAIKAYLKYFHGSFVGLTGTTKQISLIKRAYRIFSQKREQDPTDKDDYLVDHSSITYLMGPKGEFKTFISQGDGPAEIVEKLRKHL